MNTSIPHPKKSQIQSLQELSLGKTEQDVREDFIKPLLNLLGYQSQTENNIEREVALKIPFVKSGTKKITIFNFPDYILSINDLRKWVLDAKSTNESVLSIEHISQVHSYAIHKEINVSFYVLCNGNEIAIYRTIDTEYEPISYFRRSELLEYWEELYQILSSESFAQRLNFEVSNSSIKTNSESVFDKYQNKENLIDKEPLRKAIVPRKQASKLHARTHPYFTRRPWNVIQEYIRYYSNPGDTILDCFGGSGVTLIEALVLSRKGIYFDINPIACFMTKVLALAPIDLQKLSNAFVKIENKCKSLIDKSYDDNFFSSQPEYWYPQNIKLPTDADVEFLDELFSSRQLFCLSLLLHEIEKLSDLNIKVWKIRPKTKLGSHIPLDKRIQFYLQSSFHKANRLKQQLTIDEIVAEVIPYLRNGITPPHQNLFSELEKIAYSPDGLHWELNTYSQLSLKLDIL